MPTASNLDPPVGLYSWASTRVFATGGLACHRAVAFLTCGQGRGLSSGFTPDKASASPRCRGKPSRPQPSRRIRRRSWPCRSEERRVGKSVSVRVDLGGRRNIKKKKESNKQKDTYLKN